MISERYARWTAMLAQSDANLVGLALIAIAILFLWRAINRLPAPWGLGARGAFLVMTAGLVVELTVGYEWILGVHR